MRILEVYQIIVAMKLRGEWRHWRAGEVVRNGGGDIIFSNRMGEIPSTPLVLSHPDEAAENSSGRDKQHTLE